MATFRDGVLLAAGEGSEQFRQIWHISYPGGEVHRMTNDLTDYDVVSVTKNGSAVAAIQKETPAGIWLMTPGQMETAVRISHADLRDIDSLAWMPDGRIVYSARAGEHRSLWVTGFAGENPKQLTGGRADSGEVAVTRDGRYILYQSQGKIWRMDADGSGARQLTYGALDVHPFPSADGREVLYGSSIRGRR